MNSTHSSAGAAARLADAVRQTAQSSADAVASVRRLTVQHEGKIADLAQLAVHGVGAGVVVGAAGTARAAQHLSRALHQRAERAGASVQDWVAGAADSSSRRWAGAAAGLLVQGAARGVGVAASAVKVAAQVVQQAGRVTQAAAPVLGGAAGGLLRGAVEMVSGSVDTLVLSERDLQAMQQRLKTLGRQAQQRSALYLDSLKLAQSQRRKAELLDLLVVGGLTLSAVLRDPAGVPAQLEQAFALAYPGLAATESLASAVQRMGSDELIGLAAGVKGKLFEWHLVEHLNDGQLPDGLFAELAASSTQAGWDLRILDAQGQVHQVLQAKATESVAYVQEALQRYPDIDVFSTSEVHAELLARGLAEQVHDSGIAEAMLEAKVNAALDSATGLDAGDLVPSAVGMAVIALSVLLDPGNTELRQQGADFGARTAQAGLSGWIGKAALTASNTWWLGLLAGVSSRWLVARGLARRERYERLHRALEQVERRRQLAAPALELPRLESR